jgi:hypothetical protein
MNSLSYCYNIYFEIRIAQAFPFLKDSTVSNLKPQNQKLNEDGRHFPIIEYAHLNVLRLINAHVDYAEQFLLNTKTCLSNSIFLVATMSHFRVSLTILQEMRHESIVVKSKVFILVKNLIYRNILMFIFLTFNNYHCSVNNSIK